MSEGHAGFMLVGVGGGGCRVAAAAVGTLGAGPQAVGFDTDALATRAVPGMRCVLLGVPRLEGHGTGGDPVKARLAAQDDREAIRSACAGASLVVVVCTLGGGVGGGATPEILRTLREQGAHTLCFATQPFAFEGAERRAAADRALPLLEENADVLVVLPLDDLFETAGGATLAEAIPQADDVFASGLTLLWRLLLTPGFIPLGADDLRAMLRQSAGRCRLGVASASGSGRGPEAVARLMHGPLLRRGEGLANAHAVMLGVLAGSDLCLAELSEIMARLKAALASGCHLRMGTVLDARYAGTVQLVALVFEGCTRETPAAAPEGAAADGLMRTAAPGRRGRATGGKSKLSFGATGRGRFRNVEPTLRGGEDLDIPTYLRRGITLDR